ncbi:MAG TPA: polysaccharide deacetylase family protein [Stellaceae bacterium]|nr:polysaccharide deacetylase family protein [Stellaceae bacterium]
MSRGDFGIAAARRILDLLKDHKISATWFIPGHTIESYPSCATSVAEAGHEIGHHGWTHRTPASLGREGEEREFERGNEAIKKLTGQYARGYRSPAWDLSTHTVELLLKHGFEYDSSMMGHDYLPYQARQGDVVTLEDPVVYGADTVSLPKISSELALARRSVNVGSRCLPFLNSSVLCSRRCVGHAFRVTRRFSFCGSSCSS